MYRVDSHKAEEFINHQEVLDTLNMPGAKKTIMRFIEQLIQKPPNVKGLTTARQPPY